MSHPIIVDTVENNFVPLLIHNNTAEDKEMLKRFNEPSWNYQVIRFLDSEGHDIIPRKDKVWDLPALTKRMIAALNKADREVPPLLQLLEQESDSSRHAQAAFSMYCFWTGELKLGAIEGVITTEAGFLDGHEVTLVTYDSTALPLPQLIKEARQLDCFDQAYVPQESLKIAQDATEAEVGILSKDYKKAKKSDQKRQLAGTRFAKLKLSPAQATKLNSFARSQPEKATSYLTREQLSELQD